MAKNTASKTELAFNGVSALLGSHKDITSLQRRHDAPSIHGDKIWDSSFVLMDFLTEFPPQKNKVVVDVGCGWGVLSCYLAKNLSLEVLGIDADPAVKPYFDLHAKKNAVDIDFTEGPMSILDDKTLRHVDIVVGADICFWPELKKEWQQLIERCAESKVGQFFLADPGREPFWQLVNHCKKRYGKKRAELWGHDIKKPFKSSKYVLEINF